MRVNALSISLVIMLTAACSSVGPKKVVLDASPEKPAWVNDNKVGFEREDRIYFKAKQTVRGDQRISGCFSLVSNDNREMMLRSVVDELKGATDEAQTDLSENAESILGRVRSGKWSGKIYGFKDVEQYFERYQINDPSGEKTERQDCYTLSYISKADYNRTLQALVNKVLAVDPRLREAVAQKQINFFGDKVTDSQRIDPPVPNELTHPFRLS